MADVDWERITTKSADHEESTHTCDWGFSQNEWDEAWAEVARSMINVIAEALEDHFLGKRPA